MPEPKENENEKDFVDRCIPIVISDGTAKDGEQGAAICHSMYKQWKENKSSSEDTDKENSMYVKSEEIEKNRCLHPSKAELRISNESDKAPKITGYAAVFNTWADINGWFKESINPGAFTKTIKEADIHALLNHDVNFVLGRNKSGTLRLREDSKGLAVEIDPVPATWANDLLISMRRGDISQMSFGFRANKEDINYDKDERVLIDVTLFDVSIVTKPAYPTTTAQVRAAFQHKEPIKVDPPKWDELDRITAKIKAGEELTEEELRAIIAYVPSLSIPPAKHIETEPPPPAKHADSAIRKDIDRVSKLLIKAEMAAPTIR